LFSTCHAHGGEVEVRGWTILSPSESDALVTIAAAPKYHINHLQLSHEICHDLADVKDDKRAARVNKFIDAAHAAGIAEVLLWDHALYDVKYYPAEFRTGPKGTIDLDNPKFWDWLKADYRAMLDRVPKAGGIVLTFIETGARAERQQSKKLVTNQEKLAAVVNAVAEVVCGERKLKLYARTFSYSQAEYDTVIGATKLFDPRVRLMMKETPHDFFLTHPNDKYAGTIDRPTLIEFDAAGEFNGQGVVANTWPEYVLGRWRDFAQRPHVIGYVARTDRYGDTRLVGRAGEVNLLALKRGAEDAQVTAEEVYDEFIEARYGKVATVEVKAAFKNALEIELCSQYTLGLNMPSHSSLAYDENESAYVRHCSGKWLEPPVEFVGHGVNREFHYWRDVVSHLVPPAHKPDMGWQWREVPGVVKAGWVTPGEQMDEAYLRSVVTEKSHGVELAEDSLHHIERAKPALSTAGYAELHDLYARTALTARLQRAVASAYFGFRVWSRGGDYQTPFVFNVTRDGLAEIEQVIPLVRNFKGRVPVGQWNWRKDADVAELYRKWITEGWPKSAKGPGNPYAGKKFDSSSAASVWEKRRATLRETWTKIIGPFPRRVPLNAKVLSTESLPDHTRLLVRYQTDPVFQDDAYVLVPKDDNPKHPGVVVLHQTSKTNMRDPVGLDGRDSMHIALVLVRRGYVCVAPRNFLWQFEGKNYEQATAEVLSHEPWKTGMAKMTWDAIRAIDLLLDQPGVDADRIGCIGHSLGGKEALYLPAFDERVKASVSCEGGVGISFSNWDAPWYLGNQVKSPEFRHDHDELISLIEPRALLIVGGESVDGAKSEPYVEKNRPVWKMIGAEDRISLLRHNAGHDLPPAGEQRDRMYAWLDRYLKTN
jgi:hypothetical protein